MLVTAEMLLENSKKINNEERKKVKIYVKELNGEIECELLNKEDYLEEVRSIADGIVEAITETYSKLEDLIHNNGF